MLGIRREFTSCRITGTCWQTFQRREYAIANAGIACRHVKTSNAAAAVHPVTIGIAPADGQRGIADHLPIVSGFSLGLKHLNATAARNGITARKFTISSQLHRRRDYDMEDENAINKHFNNPLNKYLDQEDESSEKSLEDIAREQKRKIKSVKRAQAAREFNRGPEKRSLSWDTIQQIHYLRQENPDEWSIALLAESFNVSEEVIAKVLRSKFRPSAKTRQKQDQVATKNTGYVTGEATHTQALVAPGTAHGPANNEVKENKHTYKSAQASGYEKIPKSGQKTILKKSPSSESQEHGTMRAKRDHFNKPSHETPSHDTPREKSDEKLKDPEMEFTFGNIDFENVDSLMGQVKLKPQVFKKGRNFYNEHGEFLYRI